MSGQHVNTSLNGNAALQRFERDDIVVESTLMEEQGGLTPARILAIAWRRKWIVLFFLVCGLVLGYVYTSQKVSIYQSSAQVLVMRKRQPTMTSSIASTDSRLAFLEDFVATQLTLLKSDLILQNAALKLQGIDPSASGDLDQISGMLGGGLDVSREKDSAGRGGNVLILSFRSPSREKCPRYLDAVILGYQDFLRNKYDAATQAEIDQIKQSLSELEDELKLGDKEYLANTATVNDVLDENLDDLRKRVSNTRELIDTLKRKGLSISSKLELIEKAGPSAEERKAVLAQLATQQAAAGGIPPIDHYKESEAEILRLEQDIKQKASLGSSHPDITSIKSRIEFLREQSRGLKSGPGDGNLEQLGYYKLILTAESKNNQAELAALQSNLDRDLPRAQKLGMFTAWNISFEERKKRGAQRREDLQRTKKALESTRETGGYDATVISPPSKSPVYKVEPNPAQGTMMGGVLGFLVGLAFAGLAEFFDKTFHTPDEIRRKLGRFVIGHVPAFSRPGLPALEGGTTDEKPIADASLISFHDPRSREAEAIRGLRTSLYFSTFGRGHQVIQVTSPNPGDGKSTIISNLAVSIAQSGKKTIIIDADFRKPRIHKLFPRVSSDFGISSVLIHEKELHEVIQESGIPNLHILPVGIRPKNPGELVSSEAFQELIQRIRQEYEFVLIDTPPLLAVSDPAAIATRVDGVILVIRIRPKVRPAAERANEMLNSLGANVLGVIVNSAQSGSGNDGRYGAGYNYGYSYGYKYNYKYNYDYEYSEAYSLNEELPEALSRHEELTKTG